MRIWSGVALPGRDVARAGEMQWLTRMEASRHYTVAALLRCRRSMWKLGLSLFFLIRMF